MLLEFFEEKCAECLLIEWKKMLEIETGQFIT